MKEQDAQKKEVDQTEEPLEDLTPEKDAGGGAGNPNAIQPSPDAQKKEIDKL